MDAGGSYLSRIKRFGIFGWTQDHVGKKERGWRANLFGRSNPSACNRRNESSGESKSSKAVKNHDYNTTTLQTSVSFLPLDIQRRRRKRGHENGFETRKFELQLGHSFCSKFGSGEEFNKPLPLYLSPTLVTYFPSRRAAQIFSTVRLALCRHGGSCVKLGLNTEYSL
jgi:hypothetical protein